MAEIKLTEALLAEMAGWEVMKQARSLLASGQVLSSNWTPPVLKGVVQGANSYRAGLVIKGATDVENLCSCRDSREWGTICAHSVAVGLHQIRRKELEGAPLKSERNLAVKPVAPARPAKRIQRGETGEALEIHIILPPNFAQAAAKGKVMLCFEAVWSGGRMPLSALPMNKPFQCRKADLALLEAIELLAGGDTPAMLMLGVAEFVGLLPKLAGHPNVTLGKAQELEVAGTPWRVALKAILETGGEITVRLKQPGVMPTVLKGNDADWVFQGNLLSPLGLAGACRDCLQAPVKLGRQQVPVFLSRDWQALTAACDVEANFRPEDFTLEPAPPKFVLSLSGGIALLEGLLQCQYGSRILTMGVSSDSEALWLPDPDVVTRYSTRDLGAEHAALERLKRSGFAGPDAQGKLKLSGQNGVLNFFAREYPRLEKIWDVTLEARLEQSAARNIERVRPKFSITPSGEQWFDMQIAYTSDAGAQIEASEIQRLLRSGQSYTKLRSGKFAVLDTGAVEELQEVLLDCAPQQGAQGYRIRNEQAGFLDSTLREADLGELSGPPEWKRRIVSRTGDADMQPPMLGKLDEVLRPYQKHGVGWLHFLRRNEFGGILADEMGLGKTLQTLAYLQTTVEAAKAGERLPSLIVCPTSLVFNWVAEARRFTPQLKVLALSGPNRAQRFGDIAKHDVVVTSYALIRRDAEQYRDAEFDTVVLDEAQHIKNRESQNAQAVKAVHSRHRVVLTGTPLENSVLDLWSIFDFLMPGYLGGAQDFRERYEIPIVKEKDTGAQRRLARRLRPFILRRLKRDVATELPEKIEQVAYCDLTEEQAAVYREILEAARREVLNAVTEQEQAKSRMMALNALLRLRQASCDLRLLKLEQTMAETASSKLDLFGELLEEVVDGGHRVLVFSQFVQMLALIKERLEKEEIEYCYLDGSTSDRGTVVQRFQANSQIPVFLISLKAGGTGLNLTGADTVIHFDPWWNPAVEDQATDRAHRIGQSRVVTSYKLITRGTVEEKILSLQQRKRELFQNVLSGEEALTNSLTWEEIRDLMA
ncbi:MAG: SNF2-related protein [Verrucomicrobiota bacterium]